MSILFQGQTTPITEFSAISLTDYPLHRGDRLSVTVLTDDIPNPLRETITPTIGGRNFGAWTLESRQLDVSGDATILTAKRNADAQSLADEVTAIMTADYNLAVNTTALPAAHKRWNEILDRQVDTTANEGHILPTNLMTIPLLGWIAQRIVRKGDRPSLDIWERELPRYGFTLMLGKVGAFSGDNISVVPLEYVRAPTATALTAGAITGRQSNLAPPLSRDISFTATQIEYRAGGTTDANGVRTPGGYHINVGNAPTLGEGVVLLEMRRYLDLLTSESITAAIPLDTSFNIRDHVSYDSVNYIVVGVKHDVGGSREQTTLTLQRRYTPTREQIRAGSPAPYNASALPYNSPPGQATITAEHKFTAPDPYPASPALAGKSIDWEQIGGGVGLLISPPATGLPLTKYEVSIERNGLIDGVQYRIDYTFPNPASNIGTPLVLANQPAGVYTARVVAFNAFGDSGAPVLGVSSISFTIHEGSPAKPNSTPIMDEDLTNLAGLTPEQQDAILAQGRVQGDASAAATNQAVLITAGALTTTAILATGIGVTAGIVLSTNLAAVVSLIGTKAFLISVAVNPGLFAGYLATASSGFIAISVIAASALVLPLAIITGIGLYSRANRRRVVILATAQGNGARVGVQFQWRDWVSGAPTAWADIEDSATSSEGIPAIATDADAIERVAAQYNGQWLAGIAASLTDRRFQYRVRTRKISGLDNDMHAIWADSPGADEGWVTSRVYLLSDWRAAQRDDNGEYLPSEGTGFSDAHRPPRTEDPP